jgi:hypothetical protein
MVLGTRTFVDGPNILGGSVIEKKPQPMVGEAVQQAPETKDDKHAVGDDEH